MTGEKDGPPTLPNFGLADGIAASYGTFATMFALYHRDAQGSGEGQFIDLSIYEPIFQVLGPQPLAFDQLGVIQERMGNRSENNAPRNTYETRDGKWVAISTNSPAIVRRVLTLCGGEEAANDPRFQTPQGRVEHIDEVDGMVADWIKQRDQKRYSRSSKKPKRPSAPPMTWRKSSKTRNTRRAAILSSSTTKTLARFA